MSEQAVLQAIRSLTDETRAGFNRMNGRVNDQEKDIETIQQDLVRIKTLWSVAVVIGAWLFSKLGDALVVWAFK